MACIWYNSCSNFKSQLISVQSLVEVNNDENKTITNVIGQIYGSIDAIVQVYLVDKIQIAICSFSVVVRCVCCYACTQCNHNCVSMKYNYYENIITLKHYYYNLCLCLCAL